MTGNLTLVLGGAASGKSRYAEDLVMRMALDRVYIATAAAWDAEMEAKLVAHKARRDESWKTIEEKVDIAAALRGVTGAVLVDCATMWLNNVMMEDNDIETAIRDFVTAIVHCPVPIVVVSNELGLSVVPDNALARRFRNAQGALNQALAEQAQTVVVVMAGLPMAFKGVLK